MTVLQVYAPKSKMEWATPEIVVHGSIEKLTGWLGNGSNAELFGGKRSTPIDWKKRCGS